MKRRDLIQKIEKIGCVLIRHGGKHDWYQNPRTRMAQPVPRHREIHEHPCTVDSEKAFLMAEQCAAPNSRWPLWLPKLPGYRTPDCLLALSGYRRLSVSWIVRRNHEHRTTPNNGGDTMNLFSDQARRNPYPMYDKLRSSSPVLHVPPPFDMWMIFDYEGVKRTLSDSETFSSAVPAPKDWFLFFDPPRHTKLRALISRAFTPRVVANLEPRIREFSSELLDRAMDRNEMDLALNYSVPLPMKVIAELIGMPNADWPRFKRWSDEILKLSYTMRGMEADAEAATALSGFTAITGEMKGYLAEMIEQRLIAPKDDLLGRLIEAEVDGERLSQPEILGFFQLLIVGGQETTTNLINNAILCLLDNPEQLTHLRRSPGLLPSAIEEVLRFRSPIQWLMRTPKREVEMHGHMIPAGQLVLAMVGSANRDPKQFRDADRFDITRNPNLHIAFGHGIHSCIGAALARMESKIALSDLLERMTDFTLATEEPWEPRKALHVHGPAQLLIRFTSARRPTTWA